jgi:hypothetical protein
LVTKPGEPFNCTTKPIKADQRFAGQNQNFSDLFMFGGAVKETYVGRERVRDIECDVWEHHFVDAHFKRFGDVPVDYVQKTYFSAPEWKIDGKATQVPVRISASGVVNDTQIDHLYELVDFVPGNAPLWLAQFLFGDCDVQNEVRGLVAPPIAPSAEPQPVINGQVPSGIVALIFFLALFGGIAIGVAIFYVYNKRRAPINV